MHICICVYVYIYIYYAEVARLLCEAGADKDRAMHIIKTQ